MNFYDHSLKFGAASWYFVGVSLLTLIALVSGGGCSVGPDDAGSATAVDQQALAAELRKLESTQDTPFGLQSMKIDSVDKLPDGDVWQVAFTATEAMQEDVYLSVDSNGPLSEAGVGNAEFDAAMTKLRTLRYPERTAAEMARPRGTISRNVYQKVMDAGDTFDVAGRVIATKKEGVWSFSQLRVEDSSAIDDNAFPKSDLATSSLTVNSSAFQDAIAARRQLINAVNTAAADIEKRLEAEKAALLEGSRAGSVWEGELNADSDGTPLRITFVEALETGDEIIATLEDPANAGVRTVYTGALVLRDARSSDFREGRVEPNDGWQIALKAEDESSSFPFGSREHAFVVSPGEPIVEEAFRVIANRTEHKFARTAIDAALPTHEELVDAVKAASEPGKVWTGMAKGAAKAGEPVELTFVERNLETGYVRALLRSPANEFTVAILEGVVVTQGPGVYGRVVRLRTNRVEPWYDTAVGVLGDNKASLDFLIDANGALIGNGGGEAIKLKSTGEVEGYVDSISAWQTALRPGTLFEGKVWEEGKEAAMTYGMLILDLRDGGDYVRLGFQKKDDPFTFCVYTGSLSGDPTNINGYALSLDKRSNGKDQTAGIISFQYSIGVGGPNPTVVAKLRLLPDGKTITGHLFQKVYDGRQRLTMAKAEVQPELPELTNAAATDRLLKATEPEARWKGKLYSVKLKQSVDVELKFLERSDDGKNVKVAIISPDVKGVTIGYEGSLDTSPTLVNGYAVSLKKKTAGRVDSAIFGSNTGSVLQLRLSPDGKTLYGRSTLDHNYWWHELMALQRVAAE